MRDIKGLAAIKGFTFATIGSAIFLAYNVDLSKGIASLVKLGDDAVNELSAIALFYYLPGFFSIMLPALYLGKGIMMYRSIYCLIMIISVIGK